MHAGRLPVDSGRELHHFPASIHIGGRPVLRVRYCGRDVTEPAAPELFRRENGERNEWNSVWLRSRRVNLRLAAPVNKTLTVLCDMWWVSARRSILR